jgi:hypothetical protein
MNINRDPESVMAAWLDDGPADLPLDTRQAIAVGIRTVRRQRAGISWPFGPGSLLRPTLDLRRLSVGLAAVAVVAIVGAVVVSSLRQQQFAPAARLPSAPDEWSRVVIDAAPNAQGVTSLAASPRGLLATLDVDDGPIELVASTDGHAWTMVPPDAHPAIGKGGAGWALVGSDRGFLLANGDVWFSADGFDWQRLARSTDDADLGHGEMLSLAVGGPGYVAVGNGNSAWYSTDASDWSLARVPPLPTQFFADQGYGTPEVAMHAIAVAGDTLIASGTASYHTARSGLSLPVLWTSHDGKSWTSVLDPQLRDEEGPIAAGPGGFVNIVYSLQDDPGTGSVVIRHSRDGDAWTRADSLGSWFTEVDGTTMQLSVESIAASDAGFVAAGQVGPLCLLDGVPCEPLEALIWTSKDGRAWSRLPTNNEFAHAGASNVVAWGSRFVVGGRVDDRPAIWITK